MRFKAILALLFATLIIIFSLQNSEVTDVVFLAWDLSMSKVFIILGSFAIGLIAGILVSKTRKTQPSEYS